MNKPNARELADWAESKIYHGPMAQSVSIQENNRIANENLAAIARLLREMDEAGTAPLRSAERIIAQDQEIERLRALMKASYYLLRGSHAVYDPRGDTGPIHWLTTCDSLIAELAAELCEELDED